VVAILENYQQADGSIRVPVPLQKYLNGLAVIEKGSFPRGVER
jgi:seryl-tRNA synthetase